MTTSGSTRFQNMRQAGQPYTKVMADKKQVDVEVPQPNGEVLKGFTIEDCYAVRGYTYEESLKPTKDDEFNYVHEWLEHDLGQAATLDEAHSIAADWRESLRGVYEIR